MTLPPELTQDLTYRYALSALLLALALLRARAHAAGKTYADAPYTPTEGRAMGLLRLALSGLTVGSVLVYLVWPPLVAWAQVPLPPPLRWAGAALAVVCLVLFAWVNRALGKNFSATLRLRQGHTLVTTGPYAYVRHPMYTVLFSLLLAISLLAASWVCFVGGVALTLMITVMRTPKEEAMMADTFGQAWHDYAAKTPRYLPVRLFPPQ
jgi:protein-S-isoprenylcysteine O-methyltransferase Ste14